jgi:hypothetical protein
MAFARSAALLLALALAGAACGTSPSAPTTSVDTGDVVTIPNHGGDMEGHTPTGFAGSGTGLFAGDNLNATFPEGVGVQTFLTFAVPGGMTVGRAVLRSDALTVIGSPFDDLGQLLAEPVEYSLFGPDLFDLSAIGDPLPCRVVGDSGVECDVTAAVQSAADQGAPNVQFRLRFSSLADNDGQPDLALFYLTDSNTNEPGIFELSISADTL